jgi:hypothetical protein
MDAWLNSFTWTVFYVEHDVQHNLGAILKYINVVMEMEPVIINKLHC